METKSGVYKQNISLKFNLTLWQEDSETITIKYCIKVESLSLFIHHAKNKKLFPSFVYDSDYDRMQRFTKLFVEPTFFAHSCALIDKGSDTF